MTEVSFGLERDARCRYGELWPAGVHMRALSMVLLFAVLTACGAHPVVCDASTCQGCCTATGSCELATSPLCVPASHVDGGVCTTATTCKDSHATCGTIPDGCGGQLQCGNCLEGQSCGGGGTANVCAVGSCVAKTCEGLGKNCGEVSDGCSALLSCGTCTGGKTCGALGHPNVCGDGACVPKTCVGEHFTCGPLMDGCGGTLACGSCGDVEACGGGTCAPICPASCPSGYSCDATGACAGGDQLHLVFNVDDPATVKVSGLVSLNGGLPATEYCGGSTNPYPRATLVFTHATNAHYNASTSVSDCTKLSDPYAWSVDLRPGTYRVTVLGKNYSTLPDWASEVAPALVVSGAVSNLVFNVDDPATVKVGGVVTLNGGLPATDYCGGSTNPYPRATLVFTHATNAHYNASTTVADCIKATDSYAWSVALRPGTYRVSVQGKNYSALPAWAIENAAPLVVTGAVSNLVFNVDDPATVKVGGVVTLNGGLPATDYCGGSTNPYPRAVLIFTHATNPHYNATTSVADCIKATDPYAWSLALRPGTYKVTVMGRNYSALPDWSIEVAAALTVTAAVSNLAFNIDDPATVKVSGAVTLNGGLPATDYCGGSTNPYPRATLVFTHATNAHYNATTSVADCTKLSDPYAWSVDLRPGTYKVAVTGKNYSALPNWSVEVAPALVVTSAASNLVFNVDDPATVKVSGVVTLNGALPGTEYCGGSTNPYPRATLVFTHATNAHYNASTSVADCTKATDPYAWSVDLRPGTYRVTVLGKNYSALPDWAIEVAPAMVVSGAVSNALFNIDDPVAVKVSGLVTLNGALPDTDSCGGSTNPYPRATLVFTHATNAHYNASAIVKDCTKTTDPYAWSVDLRPGVYDVSVLGKNYSALPNWSVTVATRLRIK